MSTLINIPWCALGKRKVSYLKCLGMQQSESCLFLVGSIYPSPLCSTTPHPSLLFLGRQRPRAYSAVEISLAASSTAFRVRLWWTLDSLPPAPAPAPSGSHSVLPPHPVSVCAFTSAVASATASAISASCSRTLRTFAAGLLCFFAKHFPLSEKASSARMSTGTSRVWPVLVDTVGAIDSERC